MCALSLSPGRGHLGQRHGRDVPRASASCRVLWGGHWEGWALKVDVLVLVGAKGTCGGTAW